MKKTDHQVIAISHETTVLVLGVIVRFGTTTNELRRLAEIAGIERSPLLDEWMEVFAAGSAEKVMAAKGGLCMKHGLATINKDATPFKILAQFMHEHGKYTSTEAEKTEYRMVLWGHALHLPMLTDMGRRAYAEYFADTYAVKKELAVNKS